MLSIREYAQRLFGDDSPLRFPPRNDLGLMQKNENPPLFAVREIGDDGRPMIEENFLGEPAGLCVVMFSLSAQAYAALDAGKIGRVGFDSSTSTPSTPSVNPAPLFGKMDKDKPLWFPSDLLSSSFDFVEHRLLRLFLGLDVVLDFDDDVDDVSTSTECFL